ncbi:hypothetical protein D8771_27210 [Streptomyces albus]|uniref:Uncharacterized protein n=1 Tax=Streptomyces albus TaxID=1888 RepID=A0A8H1QL93_9ACTN|nr:hypothetical protein D8771_27210 [Streptomyces albus]
MSVQLLHPPDDTAVALQTLDYRGIAGDGLVGCPVRDLLPGRGGEAGCMDSVLDRIDGRVQFSEGRFHWAMQVLDEGHGVRDRAPY